MKNSIKIRRIRNKLLLTTLALACNFITLTFGQNYVSSAKYDFPKATPNVLKDSAQTLLPFYRQLNNLESKSDTARVVSIVHIGDSHVQADFQTGVTRELFQLYFGSAGRGLVAPLRMAKSNEPRNYRITSPQTWTAYRCLRPEDMPIGVAGFTLLNRDSEANVTVETLDRENPDRWKFNDVTVFYDTKKAKLAIKDSVCSSSARSKGIYSEHIELDTSVNKINFSFLSPEKKDIELYGFELKNGQNGILYHAVGINGAQFGHYASEGFFSRQIGLLDASVIVISLGTNEAYNKRFSATAFYDVIDEMIKNIRKNSPKAIIILTTPAESMIRVSKKRRIPNAQIESVRNVILKYAKNNQLAYWDLYSITGGKGSAEYWKKYNLSAWDGIHFSKEGYEYIGELLFQAIYNNYVRYK